MAISKTAELKFLLKLLGCENYRGKIVELKPNSSTSAADRDRICESFAGQGIVEYESQIYRISLSPPGKTLLKLDTTSLPVTPDELKILRGCQGSKGTTLVSSISSVPKDSRQDLIRNLAERGMLKIAKEAIKDVWLTVQGKQYLLYEYEPVGNSPAATGKLLSNYLRFLRENMSGVRVQAAPQQFTPQTQSTVSKSDQAKPDQQSVLEAIKQLDQLTGNKNYLPIFHLREKLQPPLTRSELDNTLYGLQREGQIDLSSLHDQGKYTHEQIAAGIRQDNGGYLFFVSVL